MGFEDFSVSSYFISCGWNRNPIEEFLLTLFICSTNGIWLNNLNWMHSTRLKEVVGFFWNFDSDISKKGVCSFSKNIFSFHMAFMRLVLHLLFDYSLVGCDLQWILFTDWHCLRFFRWWFVVWLMKFFLFHIMWMMGFSCQAWGFLCSCLVVSFHCWDPNWTTWIGFSLQMRMFPKCGFSISLIDLIHIVWWDPPWFLQIYWN